MDGVHVYIPFLLLLIVLLFLGVEVIDVRSRLHRFSLRIHINGTRGKSSVTEYIAAGLRASGRRPFAKVTGIIPTVILPIGTRQTIKRRGSPRVQEQVRMVRWAHRIQADSLVLECMSIAPEFQRIESKILHPHIYVLTNIRKDHSEQMGHTEAEQAEALCDAIPQNAVVVTTAGLYDEIIQKKAHERGSTVVFVDEPQDNSSSVLDEGVMPINLALAQRVCELAGCSPEISQQAIFQEAHCRKSERFTLQINSYTVVFINGFAINDVPSADLLLKRCVLNSPEKRLSIILNTRADRPLRTEEFATWLPSIAGIERVIVLGTHTQVADRILRSHGMSKNQIIVLRKKEVQHPRESLQKIVSHPTTLIGLGNIAGDGFELVRGLERGRRDGH
jgi:poly-gamma-glutamate synthase PgsB/CapB